MAVFPLCMVGTEGGPDPDRALACFSIPWFMNGACGNRNNTLVGAHLLSWLCLKLTWKPQTICLYPGPQLTHLKIMDLDIVPQESSSWDTLPLRQKAKILMTLPYPSSNAFFAFYLQEPCLLVWGSAVYRLEGWRLESDRRPLIQTPQFITIWFGQVT